MQPIKFTKDFSQGEKSWSYVPGVRDQNQAGSPGLNFSEDLYAQFRNK